MIYKSEFRIEQYECYYGDEKQVKKTMNECEICGADLVHSHVGDFRNFFVQEVSQCLDCGEKPRKIFHALN